MAATMAARQARSASMNSPVSRRSSSTRRRPRRGRRCDGWGSACAAWRAAAGSSKRRRPWIVHARRGCDVGTAPAEAHHVVHRLLIPVTPARRARRSVALRSVRSPTAITRTGQIAVEALATRNQSASRTSSRGGCAGRTGGNAPRGPAHPHPGVRQRRASDRRDTRLLFQRPGARRRDGRRRDPFARTTPRCRRPRDQTPWRHDRVSRDEKGTRPGRSDLHGLHRRADRGAAGPPPVDPNSST